MVYQVLDVHVHRLRNWQKGGGEIMRLESLLVRCVYGALLLYIHASE